ncbi:hypothetical protein [Pseudomonas sp. NA-150]|uniref:hypothetical protein n=1 Tax=Pseudomonas sp. NA-150 TaxID=3367525 RepID=UPI0037C9C4B2
MDVRPSLSSLALALTLLISGCSEKTEEQQQAAFKAKADQFEKKLESIQDPKLKETATDLGESLLMVDRIQLEMQKKPVETQYSENSLILLKDYPDTQSVTDTYVKDLFILRKASDSDYLTTLEPRFPFAFHFPADFPFPQKLSWQSVVLDNKKTVPFTKERLEDASHIQLSPSLYDANNPNDLDLIYPYVDGAPPPTDKDKPNPVTLNGEIQIVTPRRVSTFEFLPTEVGARRTDGNISVTLLGLNENYAEVEMQNSVNLSDELVDQDFNPLVLQAQDRTHQFLSRAAGITQSAEQLAFYQKQLDALMAQKQYSDAFHQQQIADLHAFNRQLKTHYTKAYFNGTIEKLQVSVLDYAQSEIRKTQLSLPVRQFNEHTFGLTVQPLSMPVVVYDSEAQDFLKSYEMNEEQLRKSIVIRQDVENPQDARIEFSHPPTFNEALLGPELSSESPITFYAEDDGGKPGKTLQPPIDSYETNTTEGYISYDLSQFQVPPAYASGTMPLHLAHIEKSFMDGANLPQGLTLKDNALIIDQALFPSEKWRFYGKDSKGKYLKEILSVSHAVKEYSPAMFEVHYFYGKPTSLEAYQRTGLDTVNYAFKVKLAKPSAASLDEIDQTGSAAPDEAE